MDVYLIFFHFWVLLLLKESKTHVLSETVQLADMDMSNHLTSWIPLDYNPDPTAVAQWNEG